MLFCCDPDAGIHNMQTQLNDRARYKFNTTIRMSSAKEHKGRCKCRRSRSGSDGCDACIVVPLVKLARTGANRDRNR